MNPEELQEKDKLELIDELEKRNIEYDQIKAEMVMIRDELQYRLDQDNKDGEVIGEYSVSKRQRISFGDTTLEQAKELGAVKEAKDSSKLRRLYTKGVKVPGVKETEYISVRRLKQEEQEAQSKT